MVLVKPFGPHHLAIWSGSVQTFHTRSMGAFSVRVIDSSRPAVSFVMIDYLIFIRCLLNVQSFGSSLLPCLLRRLLIPVPIWSISQVMSFLFFRCVPQRLFC